jgi:hypothetical protein
MSVQLVPFHVPSGWAILHNSFGDVDPVIHNDYIANGEFFNEHLLSVKPIEFDGTDWIAVRDGYALELGWYPQYRPEGCYRLTLTRGSEENKTVIKYETKDRGEMRQIVDRCLARVSRQVGIEEIKSWLEIEGKEIDKSGPGFRGIRKKVTDNYREKMNRLTYSQVGWWYPVYYEVCNMVYLDEKANYMSCDGLEPENQVA